MRGDRYRCFACGAHGDAIAWTIWEQHVGFSEAVHRLAADVGITVAGDSQAPDPAARAARERAFRERERERREAEEADEGRRIAIARRYWSASEQLRGTLGERYLYQIPLAKLTWGIPRRGCDLI